MAVPLKDKIKLMMQEKRLSTSELEKLAGLKISSVRNILLERTKHPKAETLQAIAEVLGCSVQELLGKELPPPLKEEPSPPLEHPRLLLESMKILVSYLEHEECTLSLDQALKVTKETYLFSSQQPNPKIDERFAKWIFNQQKKL